MDETCNLLLKYFDPIHNIRCAGPEGHEGECTNHVCMWKCRPIGRCLELGNGCAWQEQWKEVLTVAQ
jgi:hypothetical protein